MDEARKRALKHDGKLLHDILGLEFDGRPQRKHLCVFHSERTPSLNVKHDDTGWFYKCHGCGVGGDVFTARAWRDGLRSSAEAIALFAKETDYKPPPLPPGAAASARKKRAKPILDLDRAMAFVAKSQETLAADWPKIEDRFPRGISRQVCEHYGIGFRWGFRLKEYRREFGSAWVFPVLSAAHVLHGVKLHFEKTASRGNIKSMWAPFSATGEGHAFLTFWPAPEWTRWRRRIWICPGELKAFAALTRGINATSWTGSESLKWADLHARRFKGRDVTINWDDDPPKPNKRGELECAGRTFRDRAIAALTPFANSINTHTFGRLPDGSGKQDWCDASAASGR